MNINQPILQRIPQTRIVNLNVNLQVKTLVIEIVHSFSYCQLVRLNKWSERKASSSNNVRQVDFQRRFETIGIRGEREDGFERGVLRGNFDV